MTNLNELHKRVSKLIIDNSPSILTGIAVAGTITTAVLAGKASYRAHELICEAASSGYYVEPLTKKQKVDVVWKLYVPAITMGSLSVTAIIGSNRIGTRRAAAMAAAYTVSEKAFEQYREKIVEKIGENKERVARDEVAQDRVTKSPPQDHQVIVTGGGEVLFMDGWSGRYFKSDMESVKKAVNDLNYVVMNNFYASLNDFYDKLGLDRISSGEEVGWNSDKLLDVHFTTTSSDKQIPCFVINYYVDPVRDYFRTNR